MKGKENKGMEKNMKTRLRLFSLYFDKISGKNKMLHCQNKKKKKILILPYFFLVHKS